MYTWGYLLNQGSQQMSSEPQEVFLQQQSSPTLDKLTQEIVDARSVNVFKNRLDRHWQDIGI